jgi:hypothetical protein
MHDVQRHFPYFRLTGQAKADAEQSWYKRFQELPGGDVRNLSAQNTPVWTELPLCTYSPVHLTRVDAAYALDEIENPDVNPIWMQGIRSAADVAYDFNEWCRQMANNPVTPHPPIWGGQYVLVQLSGRPLQLHRVIRCKAGHEYTANVSVSTTEYMHHSEQSGGLFGTFEPAQNPQYDGKGYKYLRHSHVTREEIKLYNVNTFEDPETKRLRLHLSALRRLSETLPEYVMPNPIPQSHRAQASSDAAAASPARARGGRRRARQPAARPARAITGRGRAQARASHSTVLDSSEEELESLLRILNMMGRGTSTCATAM